MTKQKHFGVTLLEVMLVLAIGSLILIMSIKNYNARKLQVDIKALQSNVDQLFLAASNFFKGYCQAIISQPISTYSWSVSTLTQFSSLRGWQPLNNLVDNTVTPNDYIVQLNPYIDSTTQINATACNVLTPGTQCTPAGQAFISINNAKAVNWQIQVSVKLKDPTKTAFYKNILSANCASNSSGGGFVQPCEQNPQDGGYLVWERSPSVSSSQGMTSLWPSLIRLKYFNLQYTHDQMLELNNGYSTPQYYGCGS